jgi:hypothetical protein
MNFKFGGNIMVKDLPINFPILFIFVILFILDVLKKRYNLKLFL